MKYAADKYSGYWHTGADEGVTLGEGVQDGVTELLAVSVTTRDGDAVGDALCVGVGIPLACSGCPMGSIAHTAPKSPFHATSNAKLDDCALRRAGLRAIPLQFASEPPISVYGGEVSHGCNSNTKLGSHKSSNVQQ